MPKPFYHGGNRTRSKFVVVESIYQILDLLMDLQEPRLVYWDGQVLRMHKLSSRKALQIFQAPQDCPGFLGVYDHNAIYQDLADPLGELLGIHL